MKKISFLLATLFLVLISHAQISIQSQRTIGGSSNDNLMDMQLTKDGGSVIVGSSISPISGEKSEGNIGNEDYWVVKLTKTGAIEWQKTLGGTGIDEAHTVIQTKDGGYLVGGTSRSGISGNKTTANFDSSGNTSDYWIVKLNALGTIVWQKSYGGSYLDFFNSLSETKDKGFILSGSSYSKVSGNKTAKNIGGTFYTDCWVIKTDSLGNIQWQKTYGGLGSEEGIIRQTKDGGYILGCTSTSNMSGNKTENSFGDFDYWVLKLDKKGEILWQRTIGGDRWDIVADIHQTTDGGYTVGGTSHSGISGNKTEGTVPATTIYSNDDYWIVKLDANGNIVWQNDIGGGDIDRLTSIEETTDHGYIMAGGTNSNKSGDKTEDNHGENGTFYGDVWIVRTDSAGQILWDKSIGGNSSEEYYGKKIHETKSGVYVLATSSGSSRSGDKSQNSRGGEDYWILNLITNSSATENVSVQTNLKIIESPKIILYPNPVKDKLTVSSVKNSIVSLYDANGKLLSTQNVNGIGTIDMQKMPAGVYYLTVNGSKEKYIVIRQ